MRDIITGHSLRTGNADSPTKLDSHPQAATEPDSTQTRGGTASGSVRKESEGGQHFQVKQKMQEVLHAGIHLREDSRVV